MESEGLAREHAELRGKLAAHQEQIRELQSTVALDARREQFADGASRRAGRLEGAQYERDNRGAQLQAELVDVLRENELLRLALGSGPTETHSPRLGHRTVSSTQLASASSSSLSVQQRRDVASALFAEYLLDRVSHAYDPGAVLLREIQVLELGVHLDERGAYPVFEGCGLTHYGLPWICGWSTVRDARRGQDRATRSTSSSEFQMWKDIRRTEPR